MSAIAKQIRSDCDDARTQLFKLVEDGIVSYQNDELRFSDHATFDDMFFVTFCMTDYNVKPNDPDLIVTNVVVPAGKFTVGQLGELFNFLPLSPDQIWKCGPTSVRINGTLCDLLKLFRADPTQVI